MHIGYLQHHRKAVILLIQPHLPLHFLCFLLLSVSLEYQIPSQDRNQSNLTDINYYSVKANKVLTLFLRAFFFRSLSRLNAVKAFTSPALMAAWMMLQILGSSSWVQQRTDAVMASMSPLCCKYSWSTSCFSSSEPLYVFSNSRMSCTVIYRTGGREWKHETDLTTFFGRRTAQCIRWRLNDWEKTWHAVVPWGKAVSSSPPSNDLDAGCQSLRPPALGHHKLLSAPYRSGLRRVFPGPGTQQLIYEEFWLAG